LYSTGASVHDSGVPVTSTEVIEAGLDSVGVGPAMLDIADVEIVTPCRSVSSSKLPQIQEKKKDKKGRKKGTYNCSTSLLGKHLSNLYFLRSTSFPAYLFISHLQLDHECT